MLNSILSGDTPRSRALAAALILIFLGLLFGPFLFGGSVAFKIMGLICVYIIVVGSYDMMLGYTQIVSFAHMMFFGIGAYSMAIATREWGGNWGAVFGGLAIGMVATVILSLLLGLLSLRVKAIYFALVTLAVASGFLVYITQSRFFGAEDGLSVSVPTLLSPAFRLAEGTWTGFDVFGWISAVVTGTPIGEATEAAKFNVRANGRLIMYYGLFTISLLAFLGMLRMVNSPFGRVLQAIRENEFRAEALGYRTVYYRTATVVISTLLTCLAGALYALSTRFVAPATAAGFEMMVFVLLMCVIGGMGTMYGAVIGATLFLVAENYLPVFFEYLNGSAAGGETGFHGVVVAVVDWLQAIPFVGEWIAALMDKNRWLFWFGLLFVLSVYFFPLGVAGQLRASSLARRVRKLKAGQSSTGSAAA